jgi:hypothetical protein
MKDRTGFDKLAGIREQLEDYGKGVAGQAGMAFLHPFSRMFPVLPGKVTLMYRRIQKTHYGRYR